MVKSNIFFAVWILIVYVVTPVSYNDDFQYRAGQVWTYENKGGFSPAERDVVSTYTVSVQRKDQVDGKDCWVLNEEYDRWDESVREAYIGPDFSRIQEIIRKEGSDLVTIYKPPLEEPVFTLKVGEEDRKEHTLVRRVVGQPGELERRTIKRTIMRFPDETVTVPAGTFESCIRVAEFQQSDIDFSGKPGEVIGNREYWWHPDTGMVKEIRKNRVLDPDGKPIQEWTMVASLKSVGLKEQNNSKE